VAGLQVEGVHLTGAAIHPQENARAAALRMANGFGSEPIEPAGDRHAGGSRGAQAEKVATVHVELPDSFSGKRKSSANTNLHLRLAAKRGFLVIEPKLAAVQ
jgi:hypothetical protein